MHRKRIAMLTASLLFTFSCLTGCGEEEARVEVKEPEAIVVDEGPTEGAEEAEAPAPEEIPEELTTAYPVVSEERESVNGQIQSYLTGPMRSRSSKSSKTAISLVIRPSTGAS